MPNIDRREFMKVTAGAYALHAISSGAEALPAAASLSDDLCAMTVAEASRRIHSKSLSSADLTQACLERIKTYNPKINVYITVARDEALTQAKRLDLEAKAGKFRSLLHGIPIAMKDNIDTADIRTTAASAVFDDRVPTEDADVVRRLKEAGAVIIGKHNLHEFALGGSSASTYFGPARNPWALDHVPGGSSGGSAAAISADLCFGALGTDTGGSIRDPAAFCGIVGLKPTYGLVSIRGIIPMCYSLDHCGPMTKTVEDAAIMLTSMAGYDRLDIASVEHAKEDYVAAMRQPVSGFRLGIARIPFFDRLDREIASAMEEAIAVLAKLTKSTKDVHLPSTSGFDTLSLSAPEREAYHMELFRHNAGRYSLSSRRAFQSAETSFNSSTNQSCTEKVVDYVRSQWSLQRRRRTIDDSFADFDLAVLPTVRVPPRTINDAFSQDQEPKPREPEPYVNSGPFNMFGIPAISVPCGFFASGLPIGLMIVGPRFSEGRVFALANAYEKATQWHTRKPRLTPDMPVPPIKGWNSDSGSGLPKE
jgi:aspartyl-tRNA(Asn)/glutamyl-tRNA(Gln) amidotransferase subunit A